MVAIVSARLDLNDDRLVRCGRSITTRSGDVKFICDGELAHVVVAWKVRALALSAGWEQQEIEGQPFQTFRLTKKAAERYERGRRPAYRKPYASNISRTRGEKPRQSVRMEFILPIRVQCPERECHFINILAGDSLNITADIQLADYWDVVKKGVGEESMRFDHKQLENDPESRAVREQLTEMAATRVRDPRWAGIEGANEQFVAALFYPQSVMDDFNLEAELERFEGWRACALEESAARWAELDRLRESREAE